MKKRFLPYLLPVISIVFLVGFFLVSDSDSGNSVTGFAVAGTNLYGVNSDVRLDIVENQIIPGGAYMIVGLDDRKASMLISDFVVKAGGIESEGYEGPDNYVLQLSDFDIDNKIEEGKHTLSIRLQYKDEVISESSVVITAGNVN